MPLSSFSRVFQADLEKLAIGSSTVAPLLDSVMKLVQNNVNPAPDNTLAQYTICNFDGYSDVTLAAWTGPYENLNGNEVIRPTTVPSFSCTGTVTVNQVQGFVITDPTSSTLLTMYQFDTALTPTSGMQFQITPEIEADGDVVACQC